MATKSLTKAEEEFYDVQTQSSLIKAKIVSGYFPQYCKILLKKKQKEIWFLDLFSGPGKYKDGNDSTPLLVASISANDPTLRQKVRLLFNDKHFIEDLKKNFTDRFPEKTFDLEPRFADKTIGEDEAIRKFLEKNLPTPNPHPTLLFFDPWGYKGIDTKVLAKFLLGWGNEMFLFLNIKRIHAAIENNKFDELMLSLFPTRIDQLRKDRKYEATVYDRLNLIMDNLADEFVDAVNGKIYHCAFKFQEEDSTATSHFIIHFTKHSKGFELIKQVYHEYDNVGAILENDGVYTFDAKKMGVPVNSSLNFGDQNVKALSEQLSKVFKGRKISAKKLFDAHHPNTKFAMPHYAKTLRDMVERGYIKATFRDNGNHRVPVLISDNCILEFK